MYSSVNSCTTSLHEDMKCKGCAVLEFSPTQYEGSLSNDVIMMYSKGKLQDSSYYKGGLYLELSNSERFSLNILSFLNCSRKASLFRSLSN